ncbi:unnamed protein product [Cyprideis torosa]|uniref:Uncharacterized protein n=1 Tax=Cyprideis torosa TaxID=163714 RepID=A0A7R8WDG7_9CRUS|nr:unnamed protein product [Cyprideis torosa]CAG0894616.1 unnamed protein product [Cyprideis torosa]
MDSPSTDVSMTQIFERQDFQPEKYVNSLALNAMTSSELIEQKRRIESLSEDARRHLKSNVYRNYTQFIETAKEISSLESEMFHLTSLLDEQKSVINSLLELSLTGDTPPGYRATSTVNAAGSPTSPRTSAGPAVPQRGSLEGMKKLDTVEGARAAVSSLPIPRALLHEGKVKELDPSSNVPFQSLHLFLVQSCASPSSPSKKELPQGLLVVAAIVHSRGPVTFKLQSSYPTETLAVVNVRDMGGVKYAFKVSSLGVTRMSSKVTYTAKLTLLLTPSDQRVLQCDCADTKAKWLEQFEWMKRASSAGGGSAGSQRRKDDGRRDSEQQSTSTSSHASPGAKSSQSIRSAGSGRSIGSSGKGEEKKEVIIAPAWILEATDDLDLAIAMRSFENATELLEKIDGYFTSNPAAKTDSPWGKEICTKAEEFRVSLIEKLVHEVEVSPDKSVTGGGAERSVRNAISLLIRMGKALLVSDRMGMAMLACDLFLDRQSVTWRHRLQAIKLEQDTNQYMQKISEQFFRFLFDTQDEFMRCFQGKAQCVSHLLKWTKDEVTLLTRRFLSQVFSPQASLASVAECVATLRRQSLLLSDVGLEMGSLIDGQLQSHVESLLKDARDKLIEAVRVRAQEDKWTPYGIGGPLEMRRFLNEMKEIGLPGIAEYQQDNNWINLTENTIKFSRSYLRITEDVCKLAMPRLQPFCDRVLAEILAEQLRHIECDLASPALRDKRTYIRDNAWFLLNHLLPRSKEIYEESLGPPCLIYEHIEKVSVKILGGQKSRVSYSDPGFV